MSTQLTTSFTSFSLYITLFIQYPPSHFANEKTINTSPPRVFYTTSTIITRSRTNARDPSSPFLLPLMHFLHPQPALINTPIERGRHRQRPSNHCAHPSQEAHKALQADFAVDDFHRGDVLFPVSKLQEGDCVGEYT